MSASALPSLDKDGVSVSTSLGTSSGAEELIVRFSGNADTQVKDEIRALLLQAHKVAQERRIPKVSIDLRELEFMNSACFKAFVTWLAEVRNLDQARQYRIHFLSNDQIHWQRRSLRALSCFAANVVRVEH